MNSEGLMDAHRGTHPNLDNDEERVDEDGQSPLILSMIPFSIWSEIITYCRLSDVRHLYQTCRWFFTDNVESLESTRRYVALEPTYETMDIDGTVARRTIVKRVASRAASKVVDKTSLCDLRLLQYEPILNKWNNLVALGILYMATDETLYYIQSVLPSLKCLILNGTDITEAGLMTLTQSKNRQTNLRYLEIIFCYSIKYPATLRLRDHMHPELIIRRVPPWIDGIYDNNDGIHTYWADGAFTIEQQKNRCCGYVDVQWWWTFHEYQYGHSMELTNNMANGEFIWSTSGPRPAYRPTFPQYENCDQLPHNKASPRTVLVAICLSSSSSSHLNDPDIYLDAKSGSSFPIGVPQYYKHDKTYLPELSGAPMKNALTKGAEIMVTHVLVTPLSHLMPPPLVVQYIQLWADHMYSEVA